MIWGVKLTENSWTPILYKKNRLKERSVSDADSRGSGEGNCIKKVIKRDERATFEIPPLLDRRYTFIQVYPRRYSFETDRHLYCQEKVCFLIAPTWSLSLSLSLCLSVCLSLSLTTLIWLSVFLSLVISEVSSNVVKSADLLK